MGDEAALEAGVQALAANLLAALLVMAVARRPNGGLVAALAASPAVESPTADELAASLAELSARLPALMEMCDTPPGYRIVPVQWPRLGGILRRLLPDLWSDAQRRAATYCAGRAEETSDGVRSAWQNDEVYHLWAAQAPERHARLDALFRGRLRAHDGAGCQALLDAIADAGGENDPLVIFCRGRLASEITRDWGAAETHFCQVLDRPDTSLSLRSRTLKELGVLDRHRGQFEAALRHFDDSCRFAEQAEDRLSLANALMSKGIACTAGWMQKQLPHQALDDALACHLRSKNIFQRLDERELELRAWNNLGAVYKELGRLGEALAAYRAALSLTAPADHFMRAMLTHNMAEVQELQGHWADAQDAYEKALVTWREIAGDYEVADALLNLGRVQERRGLVDAATASYLEAIAAVESLRARLKAEETRSGFLGTQLALYERLITLSLTQPNGQDIAFETVERAKARAFIEILADRPLRPPEAVPVHLLERERALRRALTHLYAMGARAGGGGPVAARAIALETELEAIYRQIRRLDAQYAFSRTVDPLSLDEARQRLPRDAGLLEYFASGDELGAFVITREAVETRMLPGAMARLQRYVTDVQSHPAMPMRAGDRESEAEVDSLYNTLLAPLEDALADHEDLYIVPHGLLHAVPLHALGEQPLLERHRVTYAPSASVLLGHRAGSAMHDMATAAACLSLGYAGGDLRYAEMEARHVAALTGGIARTGKDATATLLYRDGAGYRTIHLACHGAFNPAAPLASGLLLADGKLDAMAIMQRLRLNAGLVVLSACDTGQAKVLRGDELMGLVRAFLYAGAETVLVSLWPVDDLATALLMDMFYRARSTLPPDPTSTAEALRRAQLGLRALSTAEALAATERLGRGVATTDDGRETETWTHAALAGLYAAPGGGTEARRLTARARTALSTEDIAAFDAHLAAQSGTSETAGTPSGRPYAHPYYWAAFILVRGGLPVP